MESILGRWWQCKFSISTFKEQCNDFDSKTRWQGVLTNLQKYKQQGAETAPRRLGVCFCKRKEAWAQENLDVTISSAQGQVGFDHSRMEAMGKRSPDQNGKRKETQEMPAWLLPYLFPQCRKSTRMDSDVNRAFQNTDSRTAEKLILCKRCKLIVLKSYKWYVRKRTKQNNTWMENSMSETPTKLQCTVAKWQNMWEHKSEEIRSKVHNSGKNYT